MKPLVTLIVATSQDLVIGSKEGGIPWSLPRDKQHFRDYTEAKWLLVGRKTYQEMTGWFGKRTPIVVTRSSDFKPDAPSHRVASSVPEAIQVARSNGVDELVVVGGASIYEASLLYANHALVTKIFIDTDLNEPVSFPDLVSHPDWSLVSREKWPRDAENEFDAELMTFENSTK